MQALFHFLVPESRTQAIAKVFLFLAVISGWNFAYVRFLSDGITGSSALVVLQGFVVAGPFVVFFYVLSMWQVFQIRELTQLSRKDGLTGLNNRHTFIQMTERRKSTQSEGVMLVLDADYFKRINDTYGHAVGDACLRAIADRLKWNLRADDVAGRIGGEEFAVFLAGAKIEQARVIGARICQPIPFSAGSAHPHLSVTLSIGAVVSTKGMTLDDMLLRADEALYAAKDAGRARLVVWRDDVIEQPPTRAKRASLN